MIRTLIVDDAPLAREGIRLLLDREKDFEIVGEASDGLEAVSAVARLSPDLTFLDVQMPSLDGFEVIERCAGLHLGAVVFVTAYDDYALRAFEANALGYLLKPITPQLFQATLQRTRQLLGASAPAEVPTRQFAPAPAARRQGASPVRLAESRRRSAGSRRPGTTSSFTRAAVRSWCA